MSQADYDYIIAGAGLSGLSLARRVAGEAALAGKRLLVVDQSLNPADDKTWSFWHRGKPPFRELIHKSWKQAEITFNGRTLRKPMQQYTYHSIRSGHFRQTLLGQLRNHPNTELLEAPIQRLEGDPERPLLVTPDQTYSASYIFQSCFTPPAIRDDQSHYPLIQHFMGWEVELSRDTFDPSAITLMDFDTSFAEGIAFIYILPSTARHALVEYTIFSRDVKPQAFYEEKLSIYLHNKFNLRPLDFNITRSEYGEIPMRDHIYAPRFGPRIINMGTVGGLTKPSTGYTFSRIQQHVEAITACLADDREPVPPRRSPLRYRAYDLWLLQILHDHPREGLRVFRQLFENNSIDEVFRFLAEDNTLMQDLRTMSRVSYGPFLRALWKTRRRLLEL